MNNYKSFKWSYPIVAAMTLGLSGCYMDSESYRHADNQRTVIVQPVAPQPKIVEKPSSRVVKTGVVKEPVQQVAPGPKRTAAPQLPVFE